MKLNWSVVLVATVVVRIAHAHGADDPTHDPALVRQLDEICGTFGASNVDTNHWTLFRKRSGEAGQLLSLCLDDDCGPATLTDGYFQRDVAAELNHVYRLTAKVAKGRNTQAVERSSIQLTSKTCPMGNPAFAPDSTAGLDIVLTIEKTQSSLPGGFPTMGAVVQSYANNGTYAYHGAGGPNHLQGPGTYTYSKVSRSTAVEDAMQSSVSFTLPYHMEYTFERPDAGRWIQHFAGGLIVFAGSFATSSSNATRQWAPSSLAGVRMSLLGNDVGQPPFERLRIRYADSTYVARERGSHDSKQGSYVVHKMSARSLVEEGTDASGQKYVRVYTFANARGGEWQEANVLTGERTHGLFRFDD
jgi:hypothetical protein